MSIDDVRSASSDPAAFEAAPPRAASVESQELAPARDFSQGKALGGSTAFRGGFTADDLSRKLAEREAAAAAAAGGGDAKVSEARADRLEDRAEAKEAKADELRARAKEAREAGNEGKAERLERRAERKEKRAEALREKAGRPKAEEKEEPASAPAAKPSAEEVAIDNVNAPGNSDAAGTREFMKAMRELAKTDPERAREIATFTKPPDPTKVGPELHKEYLQFLDQVGAGLGDRGRAEMAIDDLVSRDTSKRGGGADTLERLVLTNPRAVVEAVDERKKELEAALPSDGFQRIMALRDEAAKAVKASKK